jgi:hypothetical protein
MSTDPALGADRELTPMSPLPEDDGDRASPAPPRRSLSPVPPRRSLSPVPPRRSPGLADRRTPPNSDASRHDGEGTADASGDVNMPASVRQKRKRVFQDNSEDLEPPSQTKTAKKGKAATSQGKAAASQGKATASQGKAAASQRRR